MSIRGGVRQLRLARSPNEDDNIFQQSDGLLTLERIPLTDDELEELEVDAGYSAMFDVGLGLSDCAGMNRPGAGSPGAPPPRPGS